MPETFLSKEEGYIAMFFYLEKLYELTNSDELGGLLGSMSLQSDGKPADPAAWNDWTKAIEKAKKYHSDNLSG